MAVKSYVSNQSVFGVLIALLLILYIVITTHPQILVGITRKGMHGDGSSNSFEPLYTLGKGTTAKGQHKINGIAKRLFANSLKMEEGCI